MYLLRRKVVRCMRYKYKPSIFEVNLLYLVLGILLLTLGAYVQNREVYSGLLITEYFLILLPSLLFLKIKGTSIKEVLRLNRIGIKQVLLAIGITISTYPIAVFFQAIFYAIISLFKEVTPSAVPMPYDGLQYVISFLIIALSPGICEEVLFRGVILDSYEHLGYKKSIIISALYFGIFHFNLLNFIGPSILGIIFGIMVYKTNSIYSSMIGHTVNNGIALTIGFLLNKYQNDIDVIFGSSESIEVVPISIVDFIPLLFIILCFFIVKYLISKLEPYETSSIYADTSIEEIYNYGNLEDIIDSDDILYLSRPTDKIRYLPVVIIIFIFILNNWINLFL